MLEKHTHNIYTFLLVPCQCVSNASFYVLHWTPQESSYLLGFKLIASISFQQCVTEFYSFVFKNLHDLIKGSFY